MRPPETMPPSIVRRAAAIARGPHPCPSCECPTWAEPPVPWTSLRDYLVRCDACERPLLVRVDRDAVLRRGAAPASVAADPEMYDPVRELLERRDRRAFVARVVIAAALPLLVVALAWRAGVAPLVAAACCAALVVPSALWAPALAASAWGVILRWCRQLSGAVPRRREQVAIVEVARGRWDQLLREERRRQRDRAEHPDAVLRELERVLDERELRRVRALAERGEVPPAHLDDLLRYRRSWAATVA